MSHHTPLDLQNVVKQTSDTPHHARDLPAGGEGAPYKLVRLANGAYSVHSSAERETFHPVIGPAAEAEALYIGQTGIRERLGGLQSGEEFVVWDVGLGAAANVLFLLRATAQTRSKLRVLSFDKTTEPAWFALRHHEELGYLGGYTDFLERVLKTEKEPEGDAWEGLHFVNGEQRLRWSLRVADFPALLRLKPKMEPPHLILFDAFSPARNPDMWTLGLFQNLRGFLADSRPCLMPTYSRSTMFRVTLLLAGFFVGKGRATGEKEETTIASNCREQIAFPLDHAWLERAARSTSAEPLREPIYRQQRLAPETWEQLKAHPQFA